MDVEVIRSGNKLLTDLYIKPTDTHQYLEFSSCHVYHSKKSIPCSQALRFNRCNQDIINLSAGLKMQVTMKNLLDKKFLKQVNLPGKIYLTKIPKLRAETNFSLILLTIQSI